jgi:hypothetical protein
MMKHIVTALVASGVTLGFLALTANVGALSSVNDFFTVSKAQQ